MMTPVTIEHKGGSSRVKATGTAILNNRKLTTSADQWTIDLDITFANADTPDVRQCLDKLARFQTNDAPVSDQQLSVFGKGSYRLWGGGMPIWKAEMKLTRLTMCEWTPRLDQPIIHPSPFPDGFGSNEMDEPMQGQPPDPPPPGYKLDPLSPKLRYLDGTSVPPLLPPPDVPQ